MAEGIKSHEVYEEAVTAAGCQLAIHPVLALLALQDDGAPEAEAQIRDCAEKIVAKVAPMIWEAGRHAAASELAELRSALAKAAHDECGCLGSTISHYDSEAGDG